jgi:hypothetical protein
MIRYSQAPEKLKNAVKHNYVEEMQQEEKKISDPQNFVEVPDTNTDDNDGADNN